MNYLSTRGDAPTLDFVDVLLAGLASDGGLYVPQTWPSLSPQDIAAEAGQPYAEVALNVIAPFVGDAIDRPTLAAMIRETYEGFRHPAVAPLVQIGPDDWVLELFHGPTLAFKDMAMQLLGRLMDHALYVRGGRTTIVAATSGDTGGAAIEAFRGRERVDLFVLYPHGRVSEVQRRQMTTPGEDNVHALAIEGNFDDCQAIVKALFADAAFRQEVSLSAVNSINWARIVAQIVYYVTADVALGAPARPVSFAVPTGNFGDVFAGYVAKRMGLPVERLIVATNVNDILARTVAEGRYEVRSVVPTTSPSMDIQVSSNFERLLFETSGRNAVVVSSWMEELRHAGGFTLTADCLARVRADFGAVRIDESEVAFTMADLWQGAEYLADPHSAIAIAAARRAEKDRNIPMVALATAHPAKFPDAVEAATGIRPALPPRLEHLMSDPERFDVLPARADLVAAHIRRHRGTPDGQVPR